MEIRKEIEQLQKKLYDFSKRNPFVNSRIEKLWFLDEDSFTQLEKIRKRVNFNQKEYGIDTALKVDYFLVWVPSGKKITAENQLLSPLYYKPCDIILQRKMADTYSIETGGDFYTVNPIIQHYFSSVYNYTFEAVTNNPQKELLRFTQFFNANEIPSISLLTNFNEIPANTWSIINKPSVGVFNYKKSTLGADFERIKDNPNKSLVNLFGQERVKITKNQRETNLISDVDQFQLEAITTALKGDVTIQGPPGTGKSHLIVNLIGAFLANNKKVLFVSEKRAALEVVTERLKNLKLEDYVAYFDTSKHQKKVFYHQLKIAWEKLSAKNNSSTTNLLNNTKDEANELINYYLNDLPQQREEIGKSLWQLIKELQKSKYQSSELSAVGKVPAYKQWENALVSLIGVEEKLLQAFQVDCLAQVDFINLNPLVFSEKEPLLKLETRLKELKQVLVKSNALIDTFQLGNIGIDDLTRLALSASILNMVDKVQIDLLNEETKAYKSFNTWAKKYELLNARLQQAIKANEKWTRKPSLSEVNELLGLLSNQKKQGNSFFSRLRKNPTRLKTAFSDFHSAIGDHTKLKLLEGIKLEWRLRGEMAELEIKLKHNLKINNPATEIDLVLQLRNKLDAVSQNEYIQILEHEQSRVLIDELSTLHTDLVRFNSQKRFLFDELEVADITKFNQLLVALEEQLPLIGRWLPEIQTFFSLPREIRHFVKLNQCSVNQLDAIITYQTVLKETRFDNIFNTLSSWTLQANLAQTIPVSKLQKSNTLGKIQDGRKANFEQAEHLLATPSFKLKDKQKQRKKKYKSEKKILLHEMNKKQQHLAVKSCFSVAAKTLLNVQPVWVMNPLTVSENLPCLADIFDVVIFDESSQIPLEDAIPAIYRSKQVVVVGDEQQMPPSQFFSSSAETKTILHQSKEVYPFRMLKWHYRSKHPKLIQFSNQTFYQNQLVCFPPSSTINQPIAFNYVQGVYENGINSIEAQAVAKYCADYLQNDYKKAIIIAFSQEQEREIKHQLKKLNVPNYQHIVTRNLENAQGVEANIVLIAVGYGKNKEGVFRLNLGPVNQANGANRLNVLFTRAIKKMVVFSSVRSTDFPLSSNRGISVLKDFLSFAEQTEEQEKEHKTEQGMFSFLQNVLDENKIHITSYRRANGMMVNCLVQHHQNRVMLVDPCLNKEEVSDLYTVYSRLSADFDRVKIVLTLDLWRHKERMQNEILEFFK